MCRIDGRLLVDLRGIHDDHLLWRKVQSVVDGPRGADVVLLVEASPGSVDGIDFVRANGTHLASITVEGADPDIVRKWVAALRSDDQ